MRSQGIWNWTLPAWIVKLPDGRTINVCPEAGVCALGADQGDGTQSKHLCYALEGAYRYANVRAAHIRNLQLVMDTPLLWAAQMADELKHPRYKNARIRIHDSGDFFSDSYLAIWLDIMRGAPEGISFYAYTKSVARFRRMVEPNPPTNFRWVYSLGGKQDHLINLASERHADVFPSQDHMNEAGYSSQAAADTLAVDGPPRVGMVANRRRRALKRLSFGGLQQMHDAEAARRRLRQADQAARTGRRESN